MNDANKTKTISTTKSIIFLPEITLIIVVSIINIFEISDIINTLFFILNVAILAVINDVNNTIIHAKIS